jgi:hypothetical protein
LGRGEASESSPSAALDGLATRLRALPFTPVAAELVNAALARHLGVGDDTTLIVRLAGNANAVNAQTQAFGAFGRLSDGPDDVWKRLRDCDRGANATWRLSQSPSAFGETWSSMRRSTSDLDQAFMHGSPLRGVVRVAAKGGVDALRASVIAGVGTLAVELSPADGLTVQESPERRKCAALERRVRDAFDPRRVLNPGIMGLDP